MVYTYSHLPATYAVSTFIIIYSHALVLLQIITRKHRQKPSMFEDDDWEEILPFPCVSGFALESMHLIDGGVLKDFHKTLEDLVMNVWEDPHDPKNNNQISIRDTVVADRIAFLNKFCLNEQARKLRLAPSIIFFIIIDRSALYTYY